MSHAMFNHLDGLGKFKPKKMFKKKLGFMKRVLAPHTMLTDKKKKKKHSFLPTAPVVSDTYAPVGLPSAGGSMFQPFAPQQSYAPQQQQSYAPQSAEPQALAPVESPATDYSAVADGFREMQDSSAVEWGGLIPTDSGGVSDKRYDTEEPFSVYDSVNTDSPTGFDGIPVAAKKILLNVRSKNPTLANLFNEQLQKHDLTAGRDSFAGLSEGEIKSAWADFSQGMNKAVADTAAAYGRLAVAKVERKIGKISPKKEKVIYDTYAGQARNQLSTSPMGDYYPLFLMAGVLGVGYLLLKKK